MALTPPWLVQCHTGWPCDSTLGTEPPSGAVWRVPSVLQPSSLSLVSMIQKDSNGTTGHTEVLSSHLL